MYKLVSQQLFKNKHLRFVKQLLFTVVALATLLSVCRPSPIPASPTTKPTQVRLEPKASATVLPTAGIGLAVEDDGAPLPIEIIETQPGRGQFLGTSGKISLTFNQPMDIAKTNAAWEFKDGQGKPIAGEIRWSSPRTMEFTPEQALETSSQYLARLQKQAASAKGVSLQDELSIEFNTISPLQVSQVFPADQARDVANNVVITVIFNRPVVPLVIAEEKVQNPDILLFSPPLPGDGEWINTSVYAFRPSQPLRADTSYQVTLKAGLTDAAKETSLAEDYSWSFSTTKPTIKSYSLSEGELNPKNFLKDVPLDTGFRVDFFQPMNQTSTEDALSLSSADGENVLWESLWNEDATQIIITPTLRLALGELYTLKLDAQAKTTDGASLSEGLEWKFYTVLPPAIIGVTPSNTSNQEVFSSELRIRFASQMNIESVKERIVITPQPEDKIEWWYNEWDKSIASYSLKPSTRYEVQLQAGMEDIYGNTIPRTQVVRFTTGAYEPTANLEMPYSPPIIRQGGP